MAKPAAYQKQKDGSRKCLYPGCTYVQPAPADAHDPTTRAAMIAHRNTHVVK